MSDSRRTIPARRRASASSPGGPPGATARLLRPAGEDDILPLASPTMGVARLSRRRDPVASGSGDDLDPAA